MFSEDTIFAITLLQFGLLWIIAGVCFTRILDKSYSVTMNKIWAWIPIAQLWVIARVGRVSVWSIIWKAFLAGLVVGIGTTLLAFATESLFIYVVGQILTNVAMTYFAYFPVAERGGFSNATQLACFWVYRWLDLLCWCISRGRENGHEQLCPHFGYFPHDKPV